MIDPTDYDPLLIDAGADRLRDDQLPYFGHLIASWYGWHLNQTGFIMLDHYWRPRVIARLKRAVKHTLRNRP